MMFGLSTAAQTGAAMHSNKMVSSGFIGTKNATNTGLGKGLSGGYSGGDVHSWA